MRILIFLIAASAFAQFSPPSGGGSGSGNVTGPSSSVSGDCASFSGTTGKIIQDAGAACGTSVANSEYASSSTPVVMNSSFCPAWLGTYTGSTAQTFRLIAPIAGCSMGIQNNTTAAMTIDATTNSVTLNGAVANGTIPACATPANGCPVVIIKANGTTSWDMSAAPYPLTLSGLATQSADTVVMNASGSTAAPTAVAMPTSGTNGCAGATNALIYNTSTHALGCNTIAGSGGTRSIQLGIGGYNNGGAGPYYAWDTSGTGVSSTNFSGGFYVWQIVLAGSGTPTLTRSFWLPSDYSSGLAIVVQANDSSGGGGNYRLDFGLQCQTSGSAFVSTFANTANTGTVAFTGFGALKTTTTSIATSGCSAGQQAIIQIKNTNSVTAQVGIADVMLTYTSAY